MAMLRTLTLNTGYDDYYTVTGMEWGGLGRMHNFASVCSGKGISCARAASALGVPVRAYGLVGAEDLEHYSGKLTDEGLAHHLVPVPGSTRHNLTLLDGDGARVGAHFVAAGFTLSGPGDIAPMVERVLADIAPGDVVTLNGSTPKGLSEDTWAGIARDCLDRGACVVVDAQDAAFRAALQVPGITAFKPNDYEILALPGIAEAAPSQQVGMALDQLEAAGTLIPLVSLGERGVAAIVDGERVRMHCPVLAPVQSVMAGDSFVAGLVSGLLQDLSPADCLARGLATAAAHVAGLTGDALRERAQENLSRVLVEPLS